LLTFFTIWFCLALFADWLRSVSGMCAKAEQEVDTKKAVYGIIAETVIGLAVRSLLVYIYFWRVLPAAWGE
jgi:hypothetical protein